MSWRVKKKVYGETKLPTPDNSDDDFEPHYAKPLQDSLFGELSLSSPSESHQDSSTDKHDEEAACAPKPQKKKKKRRRKLRSCNDASTSKNNVEQLDEIDRSVMEVNALLGSPPEPSASFLKAQKIAPLMKLMSIQKKFLNSEYEMKKFMGSDNPKEERRRRQELQGLRLYRSNIIVSAPDNAFNFVGNGLSMSIVRQDGDITYFTYDHSERYQTIHRRFLSVMKNANINLLLSRKRIETGQHIEGMLEVVDSFFMIEEYDEAESMLEKIIICLQYAAHPYFNLTNPNVRLEYKYLENRPFFIALLKYIYLLSNKSCNRTALELGKVLLNLDPTDPLKVFLALEVVALRAHEHAWLVAVVEGMGAGGGEGGARLLANLGYSYALAKYYVVTKQNDSTYDLDKLLQETILTSPIIAKGLLDRISGIPKEHLVNHVLFKDLAVNHTGLKLTELTSFYTRMVYPRWREPKVLKWLLKNVNHLVDKFSPEMEATVIKNMKERSCLFNVWPSDVIRHMTVIKAMDELISDGEVPAVRRARACNPVPPLGSVDRYGYRGAGGNTRRDNALWREFFTSILTRDDNTTFLGLNWLLSRNIREYFFDSDVYYNHIEGIPYMMVPCTFILMALYIMILSVALRTIRLGVRNEPEEPTTYFDNVELD